ncbi:hypothetical protein ACLSU7_18520 [Bdellovibrio sp. HCB185ZH]|uniref:hypothetical protein n=1 Tax=Bdellovibrio sp. HCB185ZH TaxID=3394235 RepID=UPI0039A4D610
MTFDPGYYDFGYNLFVDRWETGCNWTMQSQGGKCGTRSSPGDTTNVDGSCIGTSTPTSSQGKLGDVYYQLASGGNYCYRATAFSTATGTTWTSLSSTLPLADGTAQVQGMVTNDPGYYENGVINTAILGRRGKINIGINNYNAAQVCSTQSDPNYGTKRLSRQRELVVYSGPALLTGELYAFPSFASFATVYNGTTSHQTVFGCDLYSSNPDTVPGNVADLLDTVNFPQYKEMMKVSTQGSNSKSYMIGAKATIDCESRYGVQEPYGRKFQSDMLWYSGNTASPVVTTGLISPLDNGNWDLLYNITGASTGYVIENTKFSGGLLAYSNTNYTAYVVPMGLPITATSYSSTYLSKAQVTGNGVINPSWNATQTSDTNAGYRMLSSSGRYHSRFDFTPSSSSVNIGEIRCVLPAE